MQEFSAGLDLASDEHRLVIVDGEGREREQHRVAHSEEGIATLVGQLHAGKVCRVAIEQPNEGLLMRDPSQNGVLLTTRKT